MRSILLVVLVGVISARLHAAPSGKRGAEELVPLHFVDEDVQTVIQLYEKLTGFRIVQDNFVKGKITVSSDQPVSRRWRSK